MSEPYQELNLDELGFLGRGKSRHRPRNDPALYGGDYPFIQTGDVKAANLHIREFTDTYNEAGLSQSKIWDKGTLVITIAANIAETAILAIKACFPDSIVGFIPDESKVNSYFVKYYIDYIKREMQSISQGTTQDNLSLDKIRTFKLKIPEKRIVDEITDVLLSYDNLIENNNRRIAILEEMAQSLYREWFVHYRFPGHEDVKFIDSLLGKIPEDWEVKPFTEIADVLSGGTPKTKVSEYWDGEIPFFAPKDAPASYYVLNTEKRITKLGLSKCASKAYPKDTVFITARGTVGKVVMPADNMAMNQSCYALKGKDGITQKFLFILTRNQVEYLKKNTGGATFDTIVTDTFKRMHILLPPLDLIADFSRIIESMFDAILNLTKKNGVLRKQRDLLLPKLISGKVALNE